MNKTCYVRSKVHYNTFDGLNYNLLTGCSYYLVHDSDPSAKFNIIVHNDKDINYNTTVKRTVSIIADDKTVKLGQKIGDLFIVEIVDASGNKMVQLPYDGVPKITEVCLWFGIVVNFLSFAVICNSNSFPIVFHCYVFSVPEENVLQRRKQSG